MHLIQEGWDHIFQNNIHVYHSQSFVNNRRNIKKKLKSLNLDPWNSNNLMHFGSFFMSLTNIILYAAQALLNRDSSQETKVQMWIKVMLTM